MALTTVAGPDPGDHVAPLWSVEDLARYLGVPANTVYRWRSTGKGPEGHRVGKHVRYRPADVEDWLNRHADGFLDK
jgi:excisionase family DNA binding protein